MGSHPKISVITPSWNQGQFIERTMKSVLEQEGDFDLEYIILDNESTDNTHDVIRRYESRLTWRSEKDRGQSSALKKGFSMASGDILCWLNSDDTYQPGALAAVADEYRARPFEWCFGNCMIIDENDEEIRRAITRYKIAQSCNYSYRRLLRRDFISQPSTFFTSDAYRAVGELDGSLTYAMDYEYWLRLGSKYEPRFIDKFLANFRWHGASKNGTLYRKAAWEAYQMARRHAPGTPSIDVFMHYCHYYLLTLFYGVVYKNFHA